MLAAIGRTGLRLRACISEGNELTVKNTIGWNTLIQYNHLMGEFQLKLSTIENLYKDSSNIDS